MSPQRNKLQKVVNLPDDPEKGTADKMLYT
jgi:hypothetical protein